MIRRELNEIARFLRFYDTPRDVATLVALSLAFIGLWSWSVVILADATPPVGQPQIASVVSP